MRILVLSVVAACTLFAAAPAQSKQPPPVAPTAVGTGGAAATVDATATQVALDVLRRGGNAVDAAVAAAATLGVTEPFSAGIGGGGFMLIRERSGDIDTIDHREEAPARFTERSLLDEAGNPLPFEQAVTSGLGVGVPGTVAGWEEALERYGTLSLGEALAPATRVARKGFRVDRTFAGQVEANRARFADFPATAGLYLDRDGTAPDVGRRLRNRDLARTYELLARGGADAFYEGAIARAIAAAVQAPPTRQGTTRTVRPGLMTAADLARYEAILRDPTLVQFRGYDVFGMAPPSSGGSTIGEILNIYESAEGFQPATRESQYHRFLEASKLAYADRGQYIGDPAFVTVPLARLLSQAYADERAALIGPGVLSAPQPPGPAGSTTHLTVADASGMVVAYTFTIEQIGGSAITVPGYGFLLNNELTDFNFATGTANSPAPGKRPRSSMAPTIVERDGRPFLALGSPGGASIITTVAQVLLERIEFGKSLPEAIAAPRASQRNASTTQVEPAFERSDVADGLRARGHTLAVNPASPEIGAVEAVEFLGGGRLLAAAEPVRRGGGAAGVVEGDRRKRGRGGR